ncbi:MAG: hypothetical protein FJZ08_04560 [Candidatus Omnitrophica bacterium]|nr:hypothetical protein [Candidatus Omnitrophota bacterium]
MNFKNKKILITAGPTWVPIDSVRVISNIASGQTGILLAREALRRGAKVTLFLGPVSICCLPGRMRLVRFTFFRELMDKIRKELRNIRYDLIIHSAAVSDFKPKRKAGSKLSSAKGLRLELKPLPKIIDCIKRYAGGHKTVIFKLEPGVSETTLISRAKLARDKYNAEIVVANQPDPYRAFIIDKQDTIKKVGSKEGLAKGLFEALGKRK